MPHSNRILVCGGRDFDNYAQVYKTLNEIREKTYYGKDVTIIQGGATGADSIAACWAEDNKQACWTFYANWDRDGKAAGPIRNKKMLDEGKPFMVVAFPGGKGTANMVKLAREGNYQVMKITDV